MKKSIVFTIIVTLFVACNTNNPEKNKLLGTWSEPYHVEAYVTTIIFEDAGTLVYSHKPDTTWSIVVDDAGDFARLRYAAKNHQLCISGERIVFDDSTSKFVYKPFTFSTGYSIESNVLTLDSFSYDGGTRTRFYKPLILYKK